MREPVSDADARRLVEQGAGPGLPDPIVEARAIQAGRRRRAGAGTVAHRSLASVAAAAAGAERASAGRQR